MFYFWLGRAAEGHCPPSVVDDAFRRAMIELRQKAEEPICDGDFTDEETVESDGFITCYFSGPTRPI